MICEECKQRQATVFLTQIIYGQRTKRNLCQQCASPILDQIPEHKAPDAESALRSKLPPVTLDPKRPDSVTIPDPVAVHVLATALHLKSFEIIRDLMYLNMFATMNSEIDFSTAATLCSRYGVTANKVA
jgi:hypothetical protein